ncbi:TetR/AcrR family transcriptional regulator [Paenibacillus sp. CN-4]|uniref:TetR/AcrR family transcriptional regulator n=1 Tax=Paenibacillus nanchangensis TaxID=3348343 RepID=UPI00397A1DF3
MNNEEKNTYVKKRITDTLIGLLENNEFREISIIQITQTAQVSRNSFYRNYNAIEDILLHYIRSMMQSWQADYERSGMNSNAELYGDLFKHLKEHKDFFLLLKKRNLFHMFLQVFLELYGTKPEQDNMTAYVVSFVTYGTYGWIEEWIARGMQESAETMSEKLASSGMR